MYQFKLCTPKQQSEEDAELSSFDYSPFMAKFHEKLSKYFDKILLTQRYTE